MDDFSERPEFTILMISKRMELIEEQQAFQGELLRKNQVLINNIYEKTKKRNSLDLENK